MIFASALVINAFPVGNNIEPNLRRGRIGVYDKFGLVIANRFDAMRRSLKFLHTMGAIGLMGAMACLLVLLAFTPAPTALSEYAAMRAAMGAIASWIFLPSLGLTLVAGLLAMGFNRAYHNAGWALAKLATGILIFEGGFTGVVGPMQDEAERSAAALAGHADAAALAQSLGPEQNTLWLLLAVAVVNVVLGIWRPRFTRLRD